jgi:hypothetical protein
MSSSKKIAVVSTGISLLCLLYLLEIIPALFPTTQKGLDDMVDKGIAFVCLVCLIIAFGAAQWDFQVSRKKKLMERKDKPE